MTLIRNKFNPMPLEDLGEDVAAVFWEMQESMARQLGSQQNSAAEGEPWSGGWPTTSIAAQAMQEGQKKFAPVHPLGGIVGGGCAISQPRKLTKHEVRALREFGPLDAPEQALTQQQVIALQEEAAQNNQAFRNALTDSAMCGLGIVQGVFLQEAPNPIEWRNVPVGSVITQDAGRACTLVLEKPVDPNAAMIARDGPAKPKIEAPKAVEKPRVLEAMAGLATEWPQPGESGAALHVARVQAGRAG